jgi:hypothetical protein
MQIATHRSGIDISAGNRAIDVMSSGYVTVIQEPGAIRVIVSPELRGTIETVVATAAKFFHRLPQGVA